MAFRRNNVKHTLSARRAAAMLFALTAVAAARAQFTGPSSSSEPYVLPTFPGVSTTSILTVGDSAAGYRMVGSPDGLGALEGPGNRLTLFMNHELSPGAGAVRAHGRTGAFVSRWEIDRATFAVVDGRDHNTAPTDIKLWNGSGYTAATTNYARFCSADLAAPSAYRFGTLGTDARIFMNGEENGNEGRAFAHLVTGSGQNTSWQLPRLGRFSWEDSVASPRAQEKTVVIGTDDSSPGQVYVYVGTKTAGGTDIDRAGLTNGSLYGVRVSGLPSEQRSAPAAGAFDLFEFGDVSSLSGASLNSWSNGNAVTNFLRPEDGHWDPRPGHENDFYFVTTDAQTSSGGRSRLYRLRFADVENPAAGGSVTALLDGSEGAEMLDNLTIDAHGRILIQEDPGNHSRRARIWLYDIDSGGLASIAEHNSRFFDPTSPDYLTANEESSGIIDAAALLGDGWFLLDSQAHYGLGGELVEGGQLLAMYVDPAITPEPGTAALAGVALLAISSRRRALDRVVAD